MAQDNNGNDTANFFFSKQQIEEKLKNFIPSQYLDYYYWGARTTVRFCHCAVSYVCPKCGTETTYHSEHEHFMTSFGRKEFVWNKNGRYFEPKLFEFKFFDRDANEYLLYEVRNCREAIKNIKGIHIALDESEFCKHCSPSTINPTLYLLVNIDGEPNTIKIPNVSYMDIRLLEGFLNYKATDCEILSAYHIKYNSETSSAKYIKRLKELLGIKYD